MNFDELHPPLTNPCSPCRSIRLRTDVSSSFRSSRARTVSRSRSATWCFSCKQFLQKRSTGFPQGPGNVLRNAPNSTVFRPRNFDKRKIGRLIEGNRVTRFNEVFFFQSVNMVNANHGHLTLPWLLKRNQPNQLFLNVWGTWQVTPPEAYQARSSVLVLNPILWHR